MTAKLVVHILGELYVSTKIAVSQYVKDNRPQKGMTLVADFWSSKVKGEKFLGVRAYLVTNDWEFKQVCFLVFDDSILRWH